MIDQFECIIHDLFNPDEKQGKLPVFDPGRHFNEKAGNRADIVKGMNAAFLITLAGDRHSYFSRAQSYLERLAQSAEWGEPAGFYLSVRNLIRDEIRTACEQYPDIRARIHTLCRWLADPENMGRPEERAEKIWSVFFPEGVDIYGNEQMRIEHLRSERKVRITGLNPAPLADPGRQLLFTSNILLTVPAENAVPEELGLSADLTRRILDVADEPQSYWYDHPMSIGVKPENNEVFYGLRGLSQAIEFERRRGNMPGRHITCVMSVSVTHRGLQQPAREYLREELRRLMDFSNIRLYVFTEADTRMLIERVLAPSAAHYMGRDHTREHLDVFGVDGEYGRHYSFLKAVSALWNILIDPEIKATFKIDLDQVFPQEELVAQSKASAFEHFKSALWGAQGTDRRGTQLTLGMLAGALVNRKDIDKGLFIPDVPFPDRPTSPEDMIFFSTLPQALSTEAEMMTRYNTDGLDGEHTCIQRVHVTGGTTGVLVESLRRFRPFTPSFMGRAEDQAYILSVLSGSGEKLAYLHKDGLIMRHDKEDFAAEAIKASSTGKIIGDYVRTLYFSAYARVLTRDISTLKRTLDPFTGCFISMLPVTVVSLRFCLRAASFFDAGMVDDGIDFVMTGVRRIRNALDFSGGENSLLRQAYEKERQGWDLYYDVLSALEQGLARDDAFSRGIREEARAIIGQCLITP